MKKKTILTILFSTVLAFGAKAQNEFDGELLVNIGTGGHFPRTDYVSNMAAFNLGVTAITEKGNVYMMDMLLCGGYADKDFRTGEGPIFDGDYLTSPIFSFDYGRLIKQTERFQFYPFGGIGLGGYELSHDEYDTGYPSKLGPSLNAGICLDFNFNHYHYEWSKDMHSGLRIMPSFSVAFLNAPLKVVPSFNLSVSYCFGYRAY